MKVQDLFEEPQNVFPTEFGLDNIDNNILKAKKILANAKKIPIQKLGDGYYTLYELPLAYAVINHKDENIPRISYYMEFTFKFYSLLKRKAVSQIKVWSDTLDNITVNVAKIIFFNELLEHYDTIITDSMQTPDGQRFWNRRITDAFSLGYYVYYVCFSNKEKEILLIDNMSEFEKIKNDKTIWGDNASNMTKRIVITKDKF